MKVIFTTRKVIESLPKSFFSAAYLQKNNGKFSFYDLSETEEILLDCTVIQYGYDQCSTVEWPYIFLLRGKLVIVFHDDDISEGKRQLKPFYNNIIAKSKDIKEKPSFFFSANLLQDFVEALS